MIRATRDGAIYFGQLAAIAILIWTVALAPAVLFAQHARTDGIGGESGGATETSCSIEYERAAIRAYDRLARCIEGTNWKPWYDRIGDRLACNFEYVSDAIQAGADFNGCMSIGRLGRW
jgi:hypothetical protein